MIRECGIDIPNLKPSKFDSLMGIGSKSARMFGRSGGVMEATLSSVYFFMTGKKPPISMFHLEITSPITEASYKIKDRIINVAIVSGIKNVKTVLKNLDKYDFIEVMSCVGGCIGGGGQPFGTKKDNEERKSKRTLTLNTKDDNLLYSFQNELIKELYSSYLYRPLSDKSRELLHIKKH